MAGYIKRAYPETQLIVVGFSLGGNIVCKYLGENRVNQERVLCCVSVCQGYCALRWVSPRILTKMHWFDEAPFIINTALDVHTFLNVNHYARNY